MSSLLFTKAGAHRLGNLDVLNRHAGEIAGIWHSHRDLDGFSPADQMQIAAGDWPHAVYNLATDRFWQCEPGVAAPYVGRPFVYGIYDCATLVEDWLAAERGLRFPAVERGVYGEWTKSTFDAFDRLAGQVGVEVTTPAAGDIICLGENNRTDHIGILLEDGRLLHHPAGHSSRISPYGRPYRRITLRVVRPQ